MGSQSLWELNDNQQTGVSVNQYKSAPNLNHNEFGSQDSIYHMQEKTIRLANGMEANVVIRAVKKPDTSRPSLIQSLQPSTSLLSLTGVYKQPPFSEQETLGRKLSDADSRSSTKEKSSQEIQQDMRSAQAKYLQHLYGPEATNRGAFAELRNGFEHERVWEIASA